MKIYEIVKLNRDVLKLMACTSINPKDHRYVEMYDDYIRLTNEGHKKTYIMQYLADEYNIDERTLYRVINKFSTDVSI